MTGKVGETMLEDQVVFGDSTWIYCTQHLAAHTTGWCTVSTRDKILLAAKDHASAVEECRARGFKLYSDLTKAKLSAGSVIPIV